MNTIRSIATKLDARPALVIKFLTGKGIYVTHDQSVDEETEQLITQEFDKSGQRIDRIIKALREWIAAFEAEKAWFLNSLDSNPTLALERSTTLMFLSTRADAAKRLLDAIANRAPGSSEAVIERIVEAYQREALNAARSPRRSTNPVSDYIAVEHGRTAVEVLDLVQFS